MRTDDINTFATISARPRFHNANGNGMQQRLDWHWHIWVQIHLCDNTRH